MTIDYISIGKRIRQFRLNKRITQEELAFQIGTSAAYISNIESGKKKPSLEKLVQISEVFDITINDLVYSPLDLKFLAYTDPSKISSYSSPEKQELLTMTLSAFIQSIITS